MPLDKQPISIPFVKGVETKVDPKQIPIGSFKTLCNSVFDTIGLLKKRNGFGTLASLPDATSTFATTFNGNLTAIGTRLNAYNRAGRAWVDKGAIQPVSLSVTSMIRSNTNQSSVDAAVADNGLVCTVYTDQNPSSLGTPVYKYAIADSATGQNIVAPVAIPVASGTVTGAPRVFVLGKYFVIVFNNVITAVNHLQYVAVNVNVPTAVSANTDISTQYTPGAFDAVVANNNLYLAWNGSDLGGAIRVTRLDSTLTQHNTVSFATEVCSRMSVCADTSGSTAVIYAAYYDLGTTTGKILAVDPNLSTVLAPTTWIGAGTLINVTSVASAGVATIFYEVQNAYGYAPATAGAPATTYSNYIRERTCTQAGVLGTAATVVRSLGLASKAFTSGSTTYFLGLYNSLYQPTYFLMNSSGQVVAKLAYNNGPYLAAGNYYTGTLPGVSVTDSVAQIGYFFKDLVQSVNKTQGLANASGVYSQVGINLASFDLTPTRITASEIGSNLNISGGFLWGYDGYTPVESGFHLYPDYLGVSTTTGAGGLVAQAYYYVATYEWTDNQGNIFRSAPSIPITITTTTSSSTNTIKVPTYRVTYKTANPVKIVLYRWSTAQQNYYQVTSVATPTLNDTTADSVTITDAQADSAILGNSLLYTTGGVIENIGPPATDVSALFQSRLFLIDAEDRNLLWFSKQVIEGTPVEMSDLLTIYVAPTTAAQGNTGPMQALGALDDKLIIFKKNAIYYLAGQGPDNTGANNQYSDPVFITSTVGCSNQNSIVFMPGGLMFESDKGIWLLGRDLQTSYIGASVEGYTTGASVLSAVNVPGTNQIRFTLDSGITLMYDYYVNQWGTFTNVSAVSSTLYQDLHTYINDDGDALQETPGVYLDGTRPVLMSFETGPLNLAGLQGYERAYFFYLMGTYKSPHKLELSITYDYGPGPSQKVSIAPDNYSPPYGDEPGFYGSGTYGGTLDLEDWRVFFEQGKCTAFAVAMQEIFDPSYGTVAGAGLTVSGLECIIGVKKGYRPIRSSRTAG